MQQKDLSSATENKEAIKTMALMNLHYLVNVLLYDHKLNHFSNKYSAGMQSNFL